MEVSLQSVGSDVFVAIVKYLLENGSLKTTMSLKQTCKRYYHLVECVWDKTCWVSQLYIQVCKSGILSTKWILTAKKQFLTKDVRPVYTDQYRLFHQLKHFYVKQLEESHLQRFQEHSKKIMTTLKNDLYHVLLLLIVLHKKKECRLFG
jgi:hypothetical protein